jgi:hypothetical protein
MAGSTELAVLGIQFEAVGGDSTLESIIKITGAAENLIAKLNVQSATFGYSKEAMLAYAAAQLGVTDQTQQLVRSLTELNVAQEQSRIQQSRDLELYKMRSSAAAQLAIDVENEATAYFAAMNAEIAANEAAAASQIALNAQRNRAMADNRAAAMQILEEQEAAAQAAAEAEEARITVLAAFKARTLNENRAEAMRILTEQEAQAAKIAEQQAIVEIRWSTLSYETRIKQLKELQAYQSSSSISNNVVANKFNATVPQDIQNSIKDENEYANAIKSLQAAQAAEAEGAKLAAKEVEGFGINTSRATTELVVMGREFERGNYSRMAGSFTVLGQALGGLLSPLTLISVAVTGFFFEMVKGSIEQDKMNQSLIMTGNYAGTTVGGLNALAQSATQMGGTIGQAKDAVLLLAGSGKFTADEIGKIATAATLMQAATGQSVQETIKQFEELAVQSTGRSAQASEAVVKAAIRLDDQYHFLNISLYDNIEMLNREGDAKGASEVATNALAKTVDERSKEIIANAGYVLKAWTEVKVLFSSSADWFAGFGKKTTPQEDVQALRDYQTQLKNILAEPDSGIFSSSHAEAKIAMIAVTKSLADAEEQLSLSVLDSSIAGQKTVDTSAAVHSAMIRDQEDIVLKKKSLGELVIAQQEYLQQQKDWAKDDANNGRAITDDPRLDPAKIAETNAAILKAHTPREAATAANPLDSAIVNMDAKIAGYKAQADAAQEAAATEIKAIVGVNEAQVQQRILDGEYAKLKKGWSQEDQDAKVQELLNLAKLADAQKFRLDGANAISTAQEKATKEIAALNGAIEDNAKGAQKVAQTNEDAATQLLKLWSISKDSAAGQKLLTDAQIEDQLKLQDVTEKRLLSEAKANQTSGTTAFDAGKALEQYGVNAKATALDIAQAAIAQAQLTSKVSEGVIAARLSGAATQQLGNAYKDIQTIYQKDLAIQTASEEASKIEVIGAEQAKVVAITQANQRKLALYKADAEAAIAAAIMSKDGANQAQLDEYSAFLDTYNKEVDLANKTQALDFNIAGLKDMATILTNAGTAANTLGTSFVGISKALKDMGTAYTSFAKIEKEEALAGKEDVAGRIGAYSDMAAAASNFFSTGSAGYKTLQDISKVYHAVELAMDLEQFITKLTQTTITTAAKVTGNEVGLASDATTTAASDALTSSSIVISIAAGAAKMFAQSGWGGFVGTAAMVALIAGLGYSASGGGSVPSQDTAAGQQATQGTGTVFGDPTKQSKSIEDSITLLTSNSSEMLPLTNAMLSSLKNIEAAMTGVTNIILRTAGITNGANLGIDTWGKPSGLLGKIGGFLFGSSSQSITDGGLQIGGSVGGLAQGQGVNQYANVNTQTTGFLGGLFGGNSNTNSTVTSATPQSINDQFALIFQGLTTTLQQAGTALGQSSTDVGKAVQSFVLPLTNISLQGLTGAALTSAINSVISAAMDNVSSSVFPQLQAFAQVGEGMTQTVVRVATGVEQANVALQGLGVSAINYTAIINKQGDVATEIERQSLVTAQTTTQTISEQTAASLTQALGNIFGNISGNIQRVSVNVVSGIGQMISAFQGSAADMITLYTTLTKIQSQMNDTGLNGANLGQGLVSGAGGTANLTKGLSDFLTNYFSPAEQSAIELKDLGAQFTALGVAMPTTLAGFRAMVQGINTTTLAGQTLQGGLLNLAGAFNTAITNQNNLVTSTNAFALSLQIAFQNVGLTFRGLSQDMVNSAGGNSGLTQGLADFLKNYFSPAEQAASEMGQLTNQFNYVGLVMPTTLDGFRKLVESIDTTSSAGQKLQGWLLSIAGQFSTAITDQKGLANATGDTATAAKSATDAMTILLQEMDQVTALQKSLAASKQTVDSGVPGYNQGAYLAGQVSDAQSKFANAPTDDSQAGLTARIGAATDLQTAIMANYTFQQNALATQLSAEQAAHSADIAAQNTAINAANQLSASFKQIGTYAQGLLTGSLTDLSGKQLSATLAGSFRTNLAGAQAGNADSISALSNSADAYLTDKLATSKNMQEYAATFQQVQGSLATLGQRGTQTLPQAIDTGFQISASLQQKYIDLANQTNAQLKPIQDATAIWQINLQKDMDVQVSAFNNLGLTAIQIANLLTGLDVRIGQQVAAGVSAIIGHGIVPIIPPGPEKRPAGFAAGGTHDGGWRVVGEAGVELENTGPSQIVNNSNTKSLFDSTGIISELQALRATMTKMQKSDSKKSQLIASMENILNAQLLMVCPSRLRQHNDSYSASDNDRCDAHK